jgi:hypothetical protein
MTFKKTSYLILIGITITVIQGCNTTKKLYKSSSSNQNYFTIKAVALSHCGCTEIYAESFKNGKREFQIFYNDNLARKTIYTFKQNNKTPEVKYLLATPNDNFTTPFNELDSRIFTIIDSAIEKKQGIVYPIRTRSYKGYIADTLVRHEP